jgi:hypothetical protein
MRTTIIFKVSRIIIILLNIFLLVKNEVDEDISLRAFSCYNILNKIYKGKNEMKPAANSPAMLACFLKINEDQSQKILSSMESDEIPLEQDEIDDLTGVEILNELSPEELDEKTHLLEQSIKDFQKYDKDFDTNKEELDNNYGYGDYGDYDDYNDYGMNDGEYNYNDDFNYNDYYNNDYNNDNEENSSLWKEIFVENRNLTILIIVCIIIFILVLIFGKDYDENEKNKNE